MPFLQPSKVIMDGVCGNGVHCLLFFVSPTSRSSFQVVLGSLATLLTSFLTGMLKILRQAPVSFDYCIFNTSIIANSFAPASKYCAKLG